jgi:ribonuclease J
MVATFASLISRVQQVVDAAEQHGRKVSIVGRSMVDSVNVAVELGYLSVPPNLLIPLNESNRLPPEKVVLMTTGSQGEPSSALVRIANRDHREVRITSGDTVIISATPIPGNELAVSRTIDNLLRQGAKVLSDRVAKVHVHGHGSQEELKMVLNLVRPRYFVPVHGEYRHLIAHAQLAWDLGIAQDGIFVMEDGDVLEISEDSAQVVERVQAGPIFIDGLITHDNSSQVLRHRLALSKDGVVVVVTSCGNGVGQLPPPQVVSSGFMNDSETNLLFQDLSAQVGKVLEDDLSLYGEPDLVRSKVRETARDFIIKATGQRPMIIPVVLET